MKDTGYLGVEKASDTGIVRILAKNRRQGFWSVKKEPERLCQRPGATVLLFVISIDYLAPYRGIIVGWYW